MLGQAIGETTFDVVYLTTVITIGIIMIHVNVFHYAPTPSFHSPHHSECGVCVIKNLFFFPVLTIFLL